VDQARAKAQSTPRGDHGAGICHAPSLNANPGGGPDSHRGAGIDVSPVADLSCAAPTDSRGAVPRRTGLRARSGGETLSHRGHGGGASCHEHPSWPETVEPSRVAPSICHGDLVPRSSYSVGLQRLFPDTVPVGHLNPRRRSHRHHGAAPEEPDHSASRLTAGQLPYPLPSRPPRLCASPQFGRTPRHEHPPRENLTPAAARRSGRGGRPSRRGRSRRTGRRRRIR
jgi:hypothetical protein